MVSKPPYMQPQMAEMAYTVIQETGLFMTACLDCNITGGNMWINLKDHSTKTMIPYSSQVQGPTLSTGTLVPCCHPAFPCQGPLRTAVASTPSKTALRLTSWHSMPKLNTRET